MVSLFNVLQWCRVVIAKTEIFKNIFIFLKTHITTMKMKNKCKRIFLKFSNFNFKNRTLIKHKTGPFCQRVTNSRRVI